MKDTAAGRTASANIYAHTQIAAPMVAALSTACLAQMTWLILTSRRDRRRWWRAVPAVGASVFAAYLLSSLTVTVRPAALELWFTGRLLRRRVPLSEITEVNVVRIPWWYGWGLRFTRTGVLYRVWGLEAVELKLASGSTVSIGSDEPYLLAGALRSAMAAEQGHRHAD